MAKVSIHPPKTPVTKGSNAIAAATIPNVCKMPGPPAPFVPTPLPNIAKSGMSPKGYSKKVKIENQPAAIKGATFKSMGDVASKGTGGGLVSANTHGPAKFIGPGSLSVKIEGKAVHLLAEPMLNNCGGSGNPPNAATMMGDVQPPALGDIDPNLTCLWCGKPLDGHETVKTTDKAMVKEAADQKKAAGAQTFGAMKAPNGSVLKSQSGGADNQLFNLATKRQIKMTADQRNILGTGPGRNALGNCCEQKLLRETFVKGGEAFPPAGGISGIKMGITNSISGRPSDAEIRAAKPKAPCKTCSLVLPMMLCTDEPIAEQKE